MDASLLDTDTLNEVLKQKNSAVVEHAANYLKQHVYARKLGQAGRDADLIIAATALEHSRVVVTGNTKDFFGFRIFGLLIGELPSE